MSDRRHQPTPTRLQRAAREGQVPFSPDLAHGLTLAGGVAALALLALPLLRSLGDLAVSQWGRTAGRVDRLQVDQQAIERLLLSSLPLLACVLAAAWLASSAQRGFRWTRLRWQSSRLLPAANLRKIASDADVAVAGWLKSALLLGLAAWLVVRHAESFAELAALSPGELAKQLALLLGRLAGQLSAAMIAVGILDYLWQRSRHRRRLRMTDEELRREMRESGRAR